MEETYASDFIGDDLATLGLRVEGGRVILSDCLEPYRVRIERAMQAYQNTCRKRAVPEGLSFWGVERWARVNADSRAWGRDAQAVMRILDGLRHLVEGANGERETSRAGDNPELFTFGYQRRTDIRRRARREMRARFGDTTPASK